MSCFRLRIHRWCLAPTTCPDLAAAQPRRPLTCADSSVMADCGACAGGSTCGRAPGRGSAKPGRRPSRPLRVPSGPGRPSRRRRLTAGPARRSPRRRPCRPESGDAASCPSGPAPGGPSGRAAESPPRLRAVPVPPPPPPATSATGMMSRPSFSYAVPNARRTDRLSDTFAKMVSTSISSASSCPQLGLPRGGASALLDREPATGHGMYASARRAGHPASILPPPGCRYQHWTPTLARSYRLPRGPSQDSPGRQAPVTEVCASQTRASVPSEYVRLPSPN